MKAAAARARSLGSFDQAVAFAEQAISVTNEPTEKVELMLAAAEDARIAGRLDHTEKLLREALPIAREAGSTSQALRVTTALARTLNTAFRVDEARALIDPALEEFANEDEVLLAYLNVVKAVSQYLVRDSAAVLATLETVLPIAERRGLVWLVTTSFISKGNALWTLGRRREAFGLAYISRDLAAEHGLTDIQLRVMGNLANALTETDVQASLDSSNEAIQLARKAGRRGQLVSYIGNYGYTAFLAGEWDEGLKEMDVYLAEDLSPRDRLIMLNNASIIRVSRGEQIEDAIAEMRSLGTDMSGSWELFVADPEANLALAAGDLAEASAKFVELAEDDPGVGVEYFYRAAIPVIWARDLKRAKEINATYTETGPYGPVADARTATLNAGIAAMEGRPAEALALIKEGLAGWRATHTVWDEALAGITAAELLDPSDPGVAEIVASTRAILERLRARPYLERLEAAVARAGASSPKSAPSRGAQEPATTEVGVTE